MEAFLVKVMFFCVVDAQTCAAEPNILADSGCFACSSLSESHSHCGEKQPETNSTSAEFSSHVGF